MNHILNLLKLEVAFVQESTGSSSVLQFKKTNICVSFCKF